MLSLLFIYFSGAYDSIKRNYLHSIPRAWGGDSCLKDGVPQDPSLFHHRTTPGPPTDQATMPPFSYLRLRRRHLHCGFHIGSPHRTRHNDLCGPHDGTYSEQVQMRCARHSGPPRHTQRVYVEIPRRPYFVASIIWDPAVGGENQGGKS
jgi:hypothetical protein